MVPSAETCATGTQKLNLVLGLWVGLFNFLVFSHLGIIWLQECQTEDDGQEISQEISICISFARTESRDHFSFKGVWESKYQEEGNWIATIDFSQSRVSPKEEYIASLNQGSISKDEGLK